MRLFFLTFSTPESILKFHEYRHVFKIGNIIRLFGKQYITGSRSVRYCAPRRIFLKFGE